MSAILAINRGCLQTAGDLAPITVRRMEAADRARWDEFVLRCPEATFFHRSGWKEVIERAFGHADAITEQANKLAFAAPQFWEDSRDVGLPGAGSP